MNEPDKTPANEPAGPGIVSPRTREEFALLYLQLGWYLLPVWGASDDGCECEKADCPSPGKHPLGRLIPQGIKDASGDEAVVLAWLEQEPSANLGIRCGSASTLAVLDIDSDAGEEAARRLLGGCLPTTPTARTGRGKHLFFLMPPGGVRSTSGGVGRGIPQGLDVKAEGGFVVAPPSRRQGVEYAWEMAPWDVEPIPWPAALVPSQRGPVSLRDAPRDVPPSTDYAAAALRDEVSKVASAPHTERRSTLNEAAFKLARFVGHGLLDREVVRDELTRAGETTDVYPEFPFGPEEIHKTIEDALQDGGALRPAADPAPPFRMEPVDLAKGLASVPDEIPYLRRPHLPAQALVWASGPQFSGKSLWAAWTAAALSREGHRVLLVSQENHPHVDLRRLRGMNPDPAHLELFSGLGLDLAQDGHAEELIRIAHGASLVILDTLAACWTGDEESNREVAALFRKVIAPIRAIGATILILDHVGHGRRSGSGAARGASTKGQSADIELVFEPRGKSAFRISNPKDRLTGFSAPTQVLEVEEREGVFDLRERVEGGKDESDEEAIRDAALSFIRAEPSPPSTNRVKKHLIGGGRSKVAVEATLATLEQEDPPRVRVEERQVETPGGPQRARAWVLQ